MSGVTVVDAPDIGEIFEQTVTSVSDMVVALRHENAVDLELRFRALEVSKSGILFHRSSTETGIEMTLATRVMPQTRAVFAAAPRAVDFGEVGRNQSKPARVVIMNRGSRAFQVTQISFVDNGDFTLRLVRQIRLPVIVEPGAQLPIEVECTVFRKDEFTNVGALVVSYEDVGSPGSPRMPVKIPLMANQS